jgi:hypothetical protein
MGVEELALSHRCQNMMIIDTPQHSPQVIMLRGMQPSPPGFPRATFTVHSLDNLEPRLHRHCQMEKEAAESQLDLLQVRLFRQRQLC